MDKIFTSYFLIFIIIFILTYKYLYEAPIIENFYENEPKLSLKDLKLLSKVAHSFVNGEPLKIPHNIMVNKFYIGDKIVDFASRGWSPTNTDGVYSATFENKTKYEKKSVLMRGLPYGLVPNGDSVDIASNPLSLNNDAREVIQHYEKEVRS